MKIKVMGDLGHVAYGHVKRHMIYGFQQLGHEIVEDGQDLTFTHGSMASWDEIKDFPGKKVFSCHGVDWAKGFDVPANDKIKSVYLNCEKIYFQSRFARHMAWKAFGKKEGPLIFNLGIVDLPNPPITWKLGETVHIATSAIFRPWKRLYEMERLVKMMNDKGFPTELHEIGAIGEPSQSYFHRYGVIIHDEMKKVFDKCHFYFHGAFNDYSPAVVGEAMAWGLPAIVINSGGSKDFVQDVGIVIESDPFIDGLFPLNREDILPKIDDKMFEEAYWDMMNNLSFYQERNKKWVIKEGNIVHACQQVIDLVNS